MVGKKYLHAACIVWLVCAATADAQKPAASIKPQPEEITLAGKLIRPVKWTPQLELYPAGQLRRFDLRGNLLEKLQAGVYIRVRGVVQSFLHRGSVPGNLSPFPPQWTVYLHVTNVEVLNGPGDIIKPANNTQPLAPQPEPSK